MEEIRELEYTLAKLSVDIEWLESEQFERCLMEWEENKLNRLKTNRKKLLEKLKTMQNK